jgi:N-acetylglucosaminyldiphosphoundecaprenol N-acetyl-beta-D-mannosaminyltransferase
MSSQHFDLVDIMGMQVARLTEANLVHYIVTEIGQGRGGSVVTANLDILLRHHSDPEARRVYDAASLRVADGMPLVWASKVLNEPVPERLAGSTLLSTVAARAAVEGLSMYLLGGTPESAERAAGVLVERHPSLSVGANSKLSFDARPSRIQVQTAIELLRSEGPRDIVWVGLGSPKQEFLIHELRPHFPNAWMIGVGGTFSFLCGDIERAPQWAQRSGLEWLHRMSQDPKRLAKRYLGDNLPFLGKVMADSVRRRLTR